MDYEDVLTAIAEFLVVSCVGTMLICWTVRTFLRMVSDIIYYKKYFKENK